MRGNGCLHYFVTAADGTKFCALCGRDKDETPEAEAQAQRARPTAEPASLSWLPRATPPDPSRRF